MRSLEIHIFVLLILQWALFTEALECFSCKNVHNVTECRSTVPCATDENCFTEQVGVGNNTVFNLGCKSIQQCLGHTTQSPGLSIVGRAAASDCTQCCSVNFCNKQLCTHPIEVITTIDGQCHDDPDYNCELISGAFNVCADTQHAKTFCKKWCGLCTYVDGGWSSWTAWSSCDVTCGQGSMSRARTCTKPTPSPNGLDCVGNKMEHSNCSMQHCPVHGSWSSWSPWGSCSVTCGTGLQRRDRSCSNPYPGPDGNPCFGDARDDRVCFLRACADGSWSSWSTWGTCSATCNGGMKSRSRTCDNPSPSTFGKACIGTNEDKVLCNSHSCPAPIVFFAVQGFTRHIVNSVATFGTVNANYGGGYSQTTGKFMCSIPGLYYFSVTLNTSKHTSGNVDCAIRHNGTNVILVFTTASDNAYHSASASTNILLASGDTVDVGSCSNLNQVETDATGMFNGALITPR